MSAHVNDSLVLEYSGFVILITTMTTNSPSRMSVVLEYSVKLYTCKILGRQYFDSTLAGHQAYSRSSKPRVFKLAPKMHLHKIMGKFDEQ